ncbi:hypothetical protein [Aureispira anguillae]|uniref:Uncharacterized protein n=1 Tax=Aureispira anguillae TaxID=2864201 RepID=A0A916DRV8_9BACT|nr:hypothetical protein [Aureispira anguillae]BDS12099.1 hypothetical protein AsAng_0028140 [Aureispira anguillae]
MLNQKLINLQKACKEWLDAYDGLKDQSAYQVAYGKYKELEEFCANVLDSQSSAINKEIEEMAPEVMEAQDLLNDFLLQLKQVQLQKG